jgi:copper chaperone CopZ
LFGLRASGEDETRPKCVGECCTDGGNGSKLAHVFRYGFVTLPKDINKALIIGVIVAGAISAAVPDDYFSWILGGGIASMLIMMVVGIPIYVCATASVPIAAALIAKGVSPGAALVFLMTGPATNAATIMTVWKIMGKRTAFIYLLTVVVSAIAAGLLLDHILAGAATAGTAGMPWMIPGIVKSLSALALLAVLAGSFFQSSKVGEEYKDEDTGMRIRLVISGMSCDHCANSIRRALVECAGVSSAVVDYKKGFADVTGTGFDVDALRGAVEGLGYKVTGFESPGESSGDAPKSELH